MKKKIRGIYGTTYKDLERENKQLKERYERLKQEHIDTITRNEEKQQRIDKAIDYINSWVLDEYSIAVIEKEDDICNYEPNAKEKLLEILGDKENE